MSSEDSPTSIGAAAKKSSAWSDPEKIALLASIAKSMGGKINWNSVPIPAGRTTGSSQKQYEALLKQGSTVLMTGGESIVPPARKRKTAGDVDGDTAPKAKKPRAPRKKAESKAGKAGKTGKDSEAKSAATASPSDDEENFKGEDGVAVKEEEDQGDLYEDNNDA